MKWLALIPVWEIQTVLLVILVAMLRRRRDGRRYFEGLLWCDLVFGIAALVCQRMGYKAQLVTVVYLNNIADVPLWYFALWEAADYRPLAHRRILYMWMAGTVGCAWVRFYPWTGKAILCINAIAYASWLYTKYRRCLVYG